MKKKIALLLLTTMAISLVGCGEKDTTENNDTVVEDSIVDDTTDNTDDTDSTDDVVSTEGAEGVLNAIWATY